MINQLEWDFSSCPVGELKVCWFYEYTRQAALESEVFAKFFKSVMQVPNPLLNPMTAEQLISELKDLSAYRLLKHFQMNDALASRHTKKFLGRPLFGKAADWQKAYQRAQTRVQTLIGSSSN